MLQYHIHFYLPQRVVVSQLYFDLSFRSVFLCLVGRTDLIEHHSDSFWHHFAEPVIPNTWTQEKRNSGVGVIEESHSDWSRVAVIVLKQDCAWIVTSWTQFLNCSFNTSYGQVPGLAGCCSCFFFLFCFFPNPGFNQGLFADCLVTKSEEKSTFTILFSLHQFITRVWVGSQQTQWSVQLDGMVSGFSLGSWADVPHKLLRWQQSQPAYGLGETVPGACRRSSWVVPNYSYLIRLTLGLLCPLGRMLLNSVHWYTGTKHTSQWVVAHGKSMIKFARGC